MAHHLAVLNIGRLAAPLDDPRLADFVACLPAINGLADRAPGFVWRLVGEDGDDATSVRPFGDDVIINLTVWESIESLRDYTYRSAHLEPMRRRREYFVPYGSAYLVMWWVPAGHLPSVPEAAERLAHLDAHGPSGHAFTFRQPMPAPVEEENGEARAPGGGSPGPAPDRGPAQPEPSTARAGSARSA